MSSSKASRSSRTSDAVGADATSEASSGARTDARAGERGAHGLLDAILAFTRSIDLKDGPELQWD